ncbi:hypothetical protein RYZ27_01265 [Hyphomonas sp. FCG-A18]|uniref:phosphoribosyltransferase-like protein n=1 Tax=Hyphomonas sp. FCG-A18 TaxID=3080019 RepID=UPI002B288F63|nr:hypothetical protein RYZ27_01265 [Hyphomonas sp. FCG-A18]
MSEHAWESRINWIKVEEWLSNFSGKTGEPIKQERLHALFLLSQFLYFGNLEIRVLLRALFRDLVLLPIIDSINAGFDPGTSSYSLETAVVSELSKTRFLGVGTPSESGVHLLYFFRQENGLSAEHFVDQADLLKVDPRDKSGASFLLRFPDLQRLVFIDDVCGSGETAVRYSKEGPILPEVLRLNPKIELHYYSLFATTDGLRTVRNKSKFGSRSGAVFELDESYKSMSAVSRYLDPTNLPPGISADLVRKMASIYGTSLLPNHPLGYEDGQLLFGFHHNTPDNSLPIIWASPEHSSGIRWTPIFRRYPKGLGL